MADNNTNVNDNNDVNGINDKSDTKGDGNLDTSNSNNNQEKTLTQTEVNAILKRAKLDAEKDARNKVLKEYEGKHIYTEDELTKLRDDVRNEAIAAYKKEAAMDAKKAEYKSKGLSDAQLAAIQVENVEDFDKRATELFGALLKKTPPVLTGGKTDTSSDESVDPNKALNDRLRQGFRNKKP